MNVKQLLSGAAVTGLAAFLLVLPPAQDPPPVVVGTASVLPTSLR